MFWQRSQKNEKFVPIHDYLMKYGATNITCKWISFFVSCKITYFHLKTKKFVLFYSFIYLMVEFDIKIGLIQNNYILLTQGHSW